MAAIVCIALSCFACTTKEILVLPDASQLPIGWGEMNDLRFPESDCPLISGKYLEPPDVFQMEKKNEREFLGNEGSYYGHIPFHIADEIEDKSVVLGLSANEMSINQIDATQFTVAYITVRQSSVAHLFDSHEGDFVCNDGYIEFPIYIHYGMIEGMSVNAQVRNVLFRDSKGSLIVKTTIGPYRKHIINSKNFFKEEVYRYHLTEK